MESLIPQSLGLTFRGGELVEGEREREGQG
jgi:hypothetical protein